MGLQCDALFIQPYAPPCLALLKGGGGDVFDAYGRQEGSERLANDRAGLMGASGLLREKPVTGGSPVTVTNEGHVVHGLRNGRTKRERQSTA